jgi:cystathionine beta-lyase/cystathionine gamma-synthase
LTKHLPRFGVDVTMVDTTDLEKVRAAIRPDTKVVFVETPGNPLVSICDIQAIADMAHAVGALMVVDSTWSGLVTQRPLELGSGRGYPQRYQIYQRTWRCPGRGRDRTEKNC